MKRSTYLLTGLIRLHAELGRELGYKEEEAQKVRENMRLVESVIKLVEPDYDTRQIVYLRRHQSNKVVRKRAHLSRHALAVLREATRPLMVAEIADVMIAERGLTDISVEDRDRIRNSVYCWLRDNDGKLVTKHGRYPSRWELATHS
ncbi:hypothetical protein GCM10011611_31020 [Aliidongia dinghuensis]|uniref:Uncharacterized protein n=1 Tax=Aliidongia dinghuensis TaxID=1867774 RepID=A0A8J2YV40_9PROT|nr:hypothetical protein [Aliidongia dinghuensis]GGF22761.1 hypothetical protein GCM10011611_31020 [Aliidongia dinghuensis]